MEVRVGDVCSLPFAVKRFGLTCRTLWTFHHVARLTRAGGCFLLELDNRWSHV